MPPGCSPTAQACGFSSETNGVENYHLSRRHVDHVPNSRPCTDTCIYRTKPLRGLRVCSKLQKVMFRTISGNRVSWFRDKFTNPHNSAPKRQNQEHKEAVSNSVRQPTPLSSRVVKIPRAPNFFHSGNFSCPSPLPQSSICQKPGIAKISFLRDCGTSQSASSTGDSMVERPPTCLEWASHFKTAYPTYNRDRCLNQGVGCPLPGSKHRGPVVSAGEGAAHKRSRAPSWVSGSEDICKRCGKGAHPSPDGQCLCGKLHQQTMGDPLTRVEQSGSRLMDLVPEQPSQPHCTTHPRRNQYSSRLGVQGLSGLERLETQPTNVCSHQQTVGSLWDRPVCQPPDQTTSQICELETGPRGPGNRCIYRRLEQVERICLSPFLNDRSLPQASSGTTGGGASNCNTSVACTSMVPSAFGAMCGLSRSTSTGPFPLDEGSGDTSTCSSPPGWVACLHRSFQTMQISPEVREILLSAWRPNTTKSYTLAWNKWNSWCVEHHCDPISPPLPAVLNFLGSQFLAGHAYRSLNVYRSALSAILPQVDAQKVGSHPLVSQFLRGVFHLRPPLPRYTETWDVSKVIFF